MREILVSDIPAGDGKTANLFYCVRYLLRLDMRYLEWHQICRASESASNVTSCELYVVVKKRYSISRRGHQCRIPYSKGLILSVSAPGSVPLGIRTPCAPGQLKVNGSWLRMSGSRQVSTHDFLR